MKKKFKVGDRVELTPPDPEVPVNDCRIQEIYTNGDIQLYNVFSGQGYYISFELVDKAMNKIKRKS